jgi:hypothetical protein
VGELTTAALLNQHLRDNLEWLKAPPQNVHLPTADVTVTSTSFIDLWSPITLSSAGGGFLIGTQLSVKGSTSGMYMMLDAHVDGVSIGGPDGIWSLLFSFASGSIPVSTCYYVSPKPAGSHTFKLRVRVSSGTLTVMSLSASIYVNVQSQFWVREI